MYCQGFLGMRNKEGAPVYVMLSVFGSGEFDPFRNPSEGFSVFNSGGIFFLVRYFRSRLIVMME